MQASSPDSNSGRVRRRRILAMTISRRNLQTANGRKREINEPLSSAGRACFENFSGFVASCRSTEQGLEEIPLGAEFELNRERRIAARLEQTHGLRGLAITQVALAQDETLVPVGVGPVVQVQREGRQDPGARREQISLVELQGAHGAAKACVDTENEPGCKGRLTEQPDLRSVAGVRGR